MRLRVRHPIVRRYAAPVPRLIELLRLYPSSHEGQTVVDWEIEVDRDARLRPARDGYGNQTAMLYVDGPADCVALTVTGEVLTDDRAGQVIGAPDPLPPLLFLQATRLTALTLPLSDFVARVGSGDGPLDRAHRIAGAIEERCPLREAQGFESACEVLEGGGGGAGGVAHLLVAAARAAGFPARVVSGYRFETEHAAATPHLWGELLVEGYGWIGFDPAHGQCPDDRYIRMAVGLDAREAAPVAGSLMPLPASAPAEPPAQ